MEAKAIRAATEPAIVGVFETLVMNRWGCSKFLLKDNGTEFVNRYMTSHMSQLEVTQTTISLYYAQANSVE